MAFLAMTLSDLRPHSTIYSLAMLAGASEPGRTQGTCTPPLTTKGGGHHMHLYPPLLLMKLFDCFGLLCNLSLILLYFI